MPLAIDFDVIEKNETAGGKLQLKANVPAEGTSGVTINGFDLGQHNVAQLKQLLGENDPLIEKLTPFLGSKRDAAQALIDKTPLKLDDTDATRLKNIVKKRTAQNLLRQFSEDTGKRFGDLTPGQQTGIADIFFNRAGPFGSIKGSSPKFWKKVVAEDFTGAAKEARNFFKADVAQSIKDRFKLNATRIDPKTTGKFAGPKQQFEEQRARAQPVPDLSQLQELSLPPVPTPTMGGEVTPPIAQGVVPPSFNIPGVSVEGFAQLPQEPPLAQLNEASSAPPTPQPSQLGGLEELLLQLQPLSMGVAPVLEEFNRRT